MYKMNTPTVFVASNGLEPDEWLEEFCLMAKLNKWDSEDYTDLVKLYLGNNEKMWYKKNKSSFTSWESFATLFKKKFKQVKPKSQIWVRLRSIKQIDFDTIEEFELELVALFQSAEISDEKIRTDWLISTLKPEHKKIVEEEQLSEWDKVITRVITEEQSLRTNQRRSKLSEVDPKQKEYNRNAASKSGKNVKDLVKDQKPYGQFLKMFDEMSVNLLNKDEEVVDNKLKEAEIIKQRSFGPRKLICYNCQQEGHTRNDCPQLVKKPKPYVQPEDVAKTINYIKISDDVEPIQQDIFSVEKRKSITEQDNDAPRRVGRPRLQEQAQVRNTRVENQQGSLGAENIQKTVGRTNLWAVVDTGAACSVVSSSLIEEWDLELDTYNKQTIVTADGKRHTTLVNLWVMERKEDILILGTDWLLEHRVSLNLRIPELRLPIENAEITTKLAMFTNKSQRMLEYLGHTISEKGVGTSPSKIETIKKIKPPTCVKELQSILGLTGYYRRYIEGYSKITSPLNKLLRKETKWCWESIHDDAINILKEKLITAPILGFPIWTEEFVLTTDASVTGVGAVLSQVVNGEERVIEFASRTTNKSEQNYSICHLEALAVIWSVKKFKYYLWGRRFKIRTDHKSLLQIFNGSELTGRITRWAMILRSYDYYIEHLPGKHNPADALSRNILNEDHPKANIELDIYSMDILEYVDTVQYLTSMQYPTGANDKMREKIRNRACQYYLKDGKLFKK
ncbi:Retrovirus-related Pol polyprotein from transposon, partial [Zancudomyces culisetae]